MYFFQKFLKCSRLLKFMEIFAVFTQIIAWLTRPTKIIFKQYVLTKNFSLQKAFNVCKTVEICAILIKILIKYSTRPTKMLKKTSKQRVLAKLCKNVSNVKNYRNRENISDFHKVFLYLKEIQKLSSELNSMWPRTCAPQLLIRLFSLLLFYAEFFKTQTFSRFNYLQKINLLRKNFTDKFLICLRNPKDTLRL